MTYTDTFYGSATPALVDVDELAGLLRRKANEAALLAGTPLADPMQITRHRTRATGVPAGRAQPPPGAPAQQPNAGPAFSTRPARQPAPDGNAASTDPTRRPCWDLAGASH